MLRRAGQRRSRRTVTSGGTAMVLDVVMARGSRSVRTGPIGVECIRVPMEKMASVTGLARETGCRPLA